MQTRDSLECKFGARRTRLRFVKTATQINFETKAVPVAHVCVYYTRAKSNDRQFLLPSQRRGQKKRNLRICLSRSRFTAALSRTTTHWPIFAARASRLSFLRHVWMLAASVTHGCSDELLYMNGRCSARVFVSRSCVCVCREAARIPECDPGAMAPMHRCSLLLLLLWG